VREVGWLSLAGLQPAPRGAGAAVLGRTRVAAELSKSAGPDPGCGAVGFGGDTDAVSRRAWSLLLALVSVAVAGCVGGTDAVDQAAGGDYRFVAGTGRGQTIAAPDRRAAPEVRGDLLGGGQLNVQSLRGKVVVLNFWASWCSPCRVESPDFAKVYAATKARGVEFIGISVKDNAQNAQAFVSNMKIGYPSLFDPNGKVALRFRDFPPRALPYTIVLDKAGRVAAVYLTPLLQEDIQPVVTRLAAER
jgi:peroxiredoxin